MEGDFVQPVPTERASRVRGFEDLDVWQKARSLTCFVHKCASCDLFARDFGLRDQSCRAALSIMSNIAEGFERSTKPQFSHFLDIAKASAGELRSIGYVLGDLGYVDENEGAEWLARSAELSRMIAGLMRSIKVSDHRQPTA